MNRFRLTLLFALFAAFCGPLAGSAAAGTGLFQPTVTLGSLQIDTPVSASPVNPADTVAWETCDASGDLDNNTLAAQTAPDTAVGYTLQLSDLGSYVCAVEFDATGNSVSGPYGPIGGLPAGDGPSLSIGGQPVTAGAGLTQGETLTVTPGVWGDPETISETWKDCDPTGASCNAVESGPGDTSYSLARSDAGAAIEVVETATAANGATSTATTPLTGVVAPNPPVIQSAPTVTGTAQLGDTLTVSPGGWSNLPTHYSYQWQRCSAGSCTAISGATGATYVPVQADVGDTLEVLVTADVDGVAGLPYPSYPTSPVLGVSSSGSSPSDPSLAPVVPVTDPRTSGATGRLTATMRWTFQYAPSYTQIAALDVEGPAVGSTIATRCTGKGCPFTVRRIRVLALKRCRATPGHCRAPLQVDLESQFHGHRLAIGTEVSVRISRPLDIGRYYLFVVRRRRAPSVEISCLAPGSVVPGRSCLGS